MQEEDYNANASTNKSLCQEIDELKTLILKLTTDNQTVNKNNANKDSIVGHTDGVPTMARSAKHLLKGTSPLLHCTINKEAPNDDTGQ